MEKLHGLLNFKKNRYRKPVIVAIGTFDGVHRAHKRIIGKALKIAEKLEGTSVVLTFYPHPVRIVTKKKNPYLLTSLNHRLELIKEIGPDTAVVVDFNKRFANQQPEDFISKVLKDKLGASIVVVGENFHFGRGKSGNVDLLKGLCRKFNYKLIVVPSLKSKGKVISSSLIRELVKSGDFSRVRQLLGRPFSIWGTVTKGDSRGRKLGYPTANIDPHQEAMPSSGVYAVLAVVSNV
ncbi:MAG: bifunctional riboflavin kinase/FMN adenylyltransferase [Candidatus Omnitrophica bacterium]|nr:bifunctional riboflavin kinase/FMN adenylyltransferase [Candidatus Omnitrophota bacterium]